MSIHTSLAVLIWQIVISGFFFPKPLTFAGQEQMTHLRDPQVSEHSIVLPHFKVTQACSVENCTTQASSIML